jgi:hypothetical protein
MELAQVKMIVHVEIAVGKKCTVKVLERSILEWMELLVNMNMKVLILADA